MPRNGSGGYSPPQNSWNPAINGMGALPNDWMAILNDMAAAIEASIAKDGQTPITGSLNFGNNRLRNVGAPQGQGDGLRFEQLVKGADVASATTIAFPIEGALFDITGTTTIASISGSFPGRMVLLRFTDALTLTHGTDLILPWAANVTTEANDFAMFVCLDGTKWECWLYPKAAERKAEYDARWLGTPVGWILQGEYLSGAAVPPTDDPRFRYVCLTAGLTGPGQYNEGVLTDESVSGSSPNVVATAKISLAGSPFDGYTINLINSEERYLRPGVKGRLQNSAYGSHSHSGITSTDGSHTHQGALLGGSGATVGSASPVSVSPNTSSGGSHSHSFTTNNSGDTETRTKNLGVIAYLRIL